MGEDEGGSHCAYTGQKPASFVPPYGAATDPLDAEMRHGYFKISIKGRDLSPKTTPRALLQSSPF